MKHLLPWSLLLILLLPLSPAATEYAQLNLPESRSYELALLEFKTIDLSQESNYLRFSIPLLLREKLAGIKEHTLSEEQQDALRMQLIRQQLTAERKKLAELQNKKDELLFSLKTEEVKKKELNAIDKNILAANEYIKYLKSVPLVKIPTSLPVNLKANKTTPLFGQFEYAVLPFTKKNNIDLVILGTVEEIHDYLILEIIAFDGLLEKEVYSFRTTAESVEIYRYIEEAVKKLVNLCVGREWSSLTVTTDRPESRIKVNGKLEGYGSLELKYIKPEEVLVEVSYPGYFSREERLILEPYQSYTLDVSLEDIQLEKITIRTNPAGADLYANSLWLGRTPLMIEDKAGTTELLLIKEGFNPYKIALDPALESSPPLELIREEIDLVEIQKASRNRFYTALGIWAVTIPLFYFFEGYSDDYERAQLENISILFKRMQYGSLGLNLGLAVNMGIRLYDYIKTSNNLIN